MGKVLAGRGRDTTALQGAPLAADRSQLEETVSIRLRNAGARHNGDAHSLRRLYVCNPPSRSPSSELSPSTALTCLAESRDNVGCKVVAPRPTHANLAALADATAREAGVSACATSSSEHPDNHWICVRTSVSLSAAQIAAA